MPGEFGVNVHDVHISLCSVADYGLVVFASGWVSFNINTQGAVELELQSKVLVSNYAQIHVVGFWTGESLEQEWCAAS